MFFYLVYIEIFVTNIFPLKNINQLSNYVTWLVISIILSYFSCILIDLILNFEQSWGEDAWRQHWFNTNFLKIYHIYFVKLGFLVFFVDRKCFYANKNCKNIQFSFQFCEISIKEKQRNCNDVMLETFSIKLIALKLFREPIKSDFITYKYLLFILHKIKEKEIESSTNFR